MTRENTPEEIHQAAKDERGAFLAGAEPSKHWTFWGTKRNSGWKNRTPENRWSPERLWGLGAPLAYFRSFKRPVTNRLKRAKELRPPDSQQL